MVINNFLIFSLILLLEYAVELSLANSEDARKEVKIKRCEDFVFKYDDKSLLIGDLGRFEGNYENYKMFFTRILGLEEWAHINRFLCLNLVYLGGPQVESNSPVQRRGSNQAIFWKCQTAISNVYLSKELVALVGENENVKIFILYF